MIKYPRHKSVEQLIKARLEGNGTKLVFINKSNFLFILDSVVDIGENHETVDEKIALVKKASYLITKTIELYPFVDGNKRAAAIMAEFFLAVNDKKLEASEDEFYNVLLGFARRQLKENDISNWLANNVRQI